MIQYALRYTYCRHLACGCHGTPLMIIPDGWQVKEILGSCRKCSPPLRLSPANRNKDYDRLP